MRTEVETVRGPIPTSEMGRTLIHEHVFVMTTETQLQWPGEFDEEAKVAEAITKLRELRDSGIQTIVDPTVDGLGRNIPRIQRINEAVPDLNIVVATGVYTYGDAPNFFRYRGRGVHESLPEPMVDLFVGDIRDGIQGTGVKAALLKCAIDEPGLTTGVERVLRAVAQTNRQTGTPVMVHTHPGTKTGLEVARVLDEEGVPPSAVQLAHSGDTDDVDHLTELAEKGYFLGMDRFGIELHVSFDQRVDTVVELCRRGFAGQMALAQDAACYLDWMEPSTAALMVNWNYFHVGRDVVPALLDRGVPPEQVDELLIGSPRRWFEQAG
ncbi:MAG TPA: phosphotriesterase-related protein [Mycobacteriales bacterium]|nr:phosphotriesterase-related protein [Mycobacteriales bacterium]